MYSQKLVSLNVYVFLRESTKGKKKKNRGWEEKPGLKLTNMDFKSDFHVFETRMKDLHF
jgi:hypothetical protein